jgi:hypothetical protein
MSTVLFQEARPPLTDATAKILEEFHAYLNEPAVLDKTRSLTYRSVHVNIGKKMNTVSHLLLL